MFTELSVSSQAPLSIGSQVRSTTTTWGSFWTRWTMSLISNQLSGQTPLTYRMSVAIVSDGFSAGESLIDSNSNSPHRTLLTGVACDSWATASRLSAGVNRVQVEVDATGDFVDSALYAWYVALVWEDRDDI